MRAGLHYVEMCCDDEFPCVGLVGKGYSCTGGGEATNSGTAQAPSCVIELDRGLGGADIKYQDRVASQWHAT